MSYRCNINNQPFYRFKRKSYVSSCFSETSGVSKLTVPILIGRVNDDGHSVANIALRTKSTKIHLHLQPEEFCVTIITEPANITRHFGRMPDTSDIRTATLFDFRVNIGGLLHHVVELDIDAEQKDGLIYLRGNVVVIMPIDFVQNQIFELDVYDCQQSKWKQFFTNTKLIDFKWGESSKKENVQNMEFTAVLKKKGVK